MSTNRYINFINGVVSVLRSSHLLLYSCKLSRKTYSQSQLTTILIFREVLGADYRYTIDLIDLMSRIKDIFQLSQVPHFSTIHIFMIRISSIFYTKIMNKIFKRFYSQGGGIPTVAIDPSGLPVHTPVIITPDGPE